MILTAILWAIAFGICPQRSGHSLFLGGQQMPIEARMAGMFAGFIIGGAYFAANRRLRAWRIPSGMIAVILIGFVALMGADGLNAFLFDLRLPHLYTPDLSLRLGTGLLTGLTMAAFVLPTFSSTVWQAGPDISPIANGRQLLVAVLCEAVYFAAARSGIGLLYYPVSLLAVLSVPILISVIVMIVGVSLLKRANKATRWSELALLAGGSLLIAFMFLAAVSLVRYGLFGPGPMNMPM